ncbi:MAG: sulfite dehydrogenase [Marinobacter sp.]|nr:sulfite dehydrogenase [Marinobacter sp.]
MAGTGWTTVNTRLRQVAGGGLLDRRDFLRLGAGFATIAAAGQMPIAQAQGAASARPAWQRMLGQADLPYGQPSGHEAHVQRHLWDTTPETAGFAGWHSPIQHLRGIITPNGLHFAVHHNGIPDIDPEGHRLIIHGLVERPLSFDLARLLRYPLVSAIRFIECAGNTAANALSPTAMDADAQSLSGQVSCAEWTGIPLRVLLAEAGVKPGARWVVAEGADGGSHARSLPLQKLMDDAVLALYQNGERLRPSQGYPMRLLVPGWEGNVNVKWLHRLEVTDQPAHTKDESGLYTRVLEDGGLLQFAPTMEVKSIITQPSGQQLLPEPGFYEISGLAWSGRGGIRRVEVSGDGGRSWAAAQLQSPVLDKAFTRFSIPWHWTGGRHLLMSRAEDCQGQRQPDRKAWKAQYARHSFNHYNAIQAWRVNRDGRVENHYG